MNCFSEDFIYFNDDVSLTGEVCFSDFWTETGGYVMYTGQRHEHREDQMSEHCSEDCVSVKMSDGICDDECNSLACLWDGDDCDGIAPPGGETDHRPGFYQVVCQLDYGVLHSLK